MRRGKEKSFFHRISGLCVHAKSTSYCGKELNVVVIEWKRQWTTKKGGKIPYITESIISYQNFSRYFFFSFLSYFLLMAAAATAVKCISFMEMGYERTSKAPLINDETNKTSHSHSQWFSPLLKFKAVMCVCLARCKEVNRKLFCK